MGDTGVKHVWLKKWSLGFIRGKLESPVEMSKVRQESPCWDWKGAATRLMVEAEGRVEDGCNHPEERDGGQGCGKRGSRRDGAGKHKDVSGRAWRSGMAYYKAALWVLLGVGTPTSQHRKLRHRESSGAIFL